MNLGIVFMKTFSEEIHKLFRKFQSGKPFAFSKYADGEWAIIAKDYLNNGEFEFSPQTPDFFRQKLIESIQFKDPEYYIGTCCPCCNGDRAQKMREFSGQDEDHMTFANVFVNDNYPVYKETFLKEYATRDIHLVANSNSRVGDLPFRVEKFYPIGFNAWLNNYDFIDFIKQKNVSNKTFLFCAGPFGNLLAHQLFQDNKRNTYLDIGSTLNPWLRSEGFVRDYYVGGGFSNRRCVWN